MHFIGSALRALFEFIKDHEIFSPFLFAVSVRLSAYVIYGALDLWRKSLVILSILNTQEVKVYDRLLVRIKKLGARNCKL